VQHNSKKERQTCNTTTRKNVKRAIATYLHAMLAYAAAAAAAAAAAGIAVVTFARIMIAEFSCSVFWSRGLIDREMCVCVCVCVL
jgi:hypothetical protein